MSADALDEHGGDTVDGHEKGCFILISGVTNPGWARRRESGPTSARAAVGALVPMSGPGEDDRELPRRAH